MAMAQIIVTFDDGSSVEAFVTDKIADDVILDNDFDWQEMGTFSIGRN